MAADGSPSTPQGRESWRSHDVTKGQSIADVYIRYEACSLPTVHAYRLDVHIVVGSSLRSVLRSEVVTLTTDRLMIVNATIGGRRTQTLL